MQPSGRRQFRRPQDLGQPFELGLSLDHDEHLVAFPHAVQFRADPLDLAAEAFDRFELQVASDAQGATADRGCRDHGEPAELPHHRRKVVEVARPFQALEIALGLRLGLFRFHQQDDGLRRQVVGEMCPIAGGAAQDGHLDRVE